MSRLNYILFFITLPMILIGQDEHSRFDFGKMWTFEHPPTEWFQENYEFTPDEEWFEDVRKSALKFASWCSGSFVSPDGLIMTNHHCSRDESITVQQGTENFDENGFYASTKEQERKVEGLFVDQLIKVVDVTESVSSAKDPSVALAAMVEEYKTKKGWEDLFVRSVTFYSGGKYSIYGYKRYDDIRLVMIPENDLGFYGGDPDNFTYPRYNLDCTFWRAYENGQPVNSSENYYKFNIDGIAEGTPVFVVGNPARTERYRTVAQLEFDRDYRYKQLLRFLTNRRDLMQEEYDVMSADPSMVREAQELLGNINNFSNSIKAYNGIIGGLHDERLMSKKRSMEKEIRSKASNTSYWDDLESVFGNAKKDAWAFSHLAPSPYRGGMLQLMHALSQYKDAMSVDAGEDVTSEMKTGLLDMLGSVDNPRERKLFTVLLEEIKADIYPGDNTLNNMLDGKTIPQYVDAVFNSELFDDSKREKCLSKSKNLMKSDDALIKSSSVVGSRFSEAVEKYESNKDNIKMLEQNVANQAFGVFGTDLPPDATFTLRISDGRVQGYEYNGTEAPVMTTYFGLYDRHYSHAETFPWDLPEKWQNPPMELLRAPLNFVSTNDIIGGNSGSAIINANKEAVGLIFDGNIESLPGNFIFDEKENRSVAVHAGGIYAALKYVYKADALIAELMQ